MVDYSVLPTGIAEIIGSLVSFTQTHTPGYRSAETPTPAIVRRDEAKTTAAPLPLMIDRPQKEVNEFDSPKKLTAANTEKILAAWGLKPKNTIQRNLMLAGLNTSWRVLLDAMQSYPSEGNLLANVAGHLQQVLQRVEAQQIRLQFHEIFALDTRTTFLRELVQRWISCGQIWRPNLIQEIPRSIAALQQERDRKDFSSIKRAEGTAESIKLKEAKYEACIKKKVPYLPPKVRVGSDGRPGEKEKLMGRIWK
jgi:hypothetical protein